MKTNADIEMWDELAEQLTRYSKEICEDNGCTDDEHNCGSYAYISQDGNLWDICLPDCWPGRGSYDEDRYGKIAAIPLPWDGSGTELRAAVEEDTWY